jgi:uncharacterized coiled-coil protein SlyX
LNSVNNVEQLREHIRALTEFERDYRRYIEAQEAEEAGREPELADAERTKLRRDLLRGVDAAERAMRQADKMTSVAPPPAFGGQVLTSLSDQVFAHETPLFGSGEPWLGLPFGLADTMVAALGALEAQLTEAQGTAERRRADLEEVQTQMDQLDEHFSERFEQFEPTGPTRRQRNEARASRSPWYHNQWVIVIGGGAIATVLGGIILALVL